MRLTIMTPNKIIDEREVIKVSAIGREGSFTLLPGHVDIFSSLVRCIVSAEDSDQKVHVYAADGGILTKEGPMVRISSPFAVKGQVINEDDPEQGLAERIDNALSELEKESGHIRTETLRVETDLVRRMIELEGEL